MSFRHMRKRNFVDKKLQGTLLLQTARYWLVSVTAVAMFTMLGWIFVSPGIEGLVNLRHELPAVLGGLVMAVVSTLLVVPFILMDFARVTNRFAGPMYRLHRAMQRAADGKPVEPVRFRDGDFWQEYADTFNRLLLRIERLESLRTSSPQQRPDDDTASVEPTQQPVLSS